MDGVCLVQHSAPKWMNKKKTWVIRMSYVSRRRLILILIVASANVSSMTSGLEVCVCWNFPGSFYDSHCFVFLHSHTKEKENLHAIISNSDCSFLCCTRVGGWILPGPGNWYYNLFSSSILDKAFIVAPSAPKGSNTVISSTSRKNATAEASFLCNDSDCCSCIKVELVLILDVLERKN